MELNINSPAYYTNQYGVIDEIYIMCRSLSEYVKEKKYSDLVDVIGITPIVAPEELIEQGLFKEIKKCELKYRFASVSLHIDYESFLQSNMEEKKRLIIENVVKSMEAIHKRAGIVMEEFNNDIKLFYERFEVKGI